MNHVLEFMLVVWLTISLLWTYFMFIWTKIIEISKKLKSVTINLNSLVCSIFYLIILVLQKYSGEHFCYFISFEKSSKMFMIRVFLVNKWLDQCNSAQLII